MLHGVAQPNMSAMDESEEWTNSEEQVDAPDNPGTAIQLVYVAIALPFASKVATIRA